MCCFLSSSTFLRSLMLKPASMSMSGLTALLSIVDKKNPQFEHAHVPYCFAYVLCSPTCIVEKGSKTSLLQIGQIGNVKSVKSFPNNYLGLLIKITYPLFSCSITFTLCARMVRR